MTYAVTWWHQAQKQLAEAWLAAEDRNRVTAASHESDQTLGRDPLHTGESRASSVQRTAFFGPLQVYFDVIEDDKKVIVTAVEWHG